MPLSRRSLLQGLAATSGAGLLAGRPGRSRAAPSAADRKFLFVMNTGGWDTTYALTPAFDSPGVDMPPDAAPGSAGGIDFVDSELQPSVRWFFEEHASKVALLHGIEVRSVTHERCRQLMMTGRGDAAADDWPAILGANGDRSLVLPHLVLAGPAYTDKYTGNVVRVGDSAQLPKLLDGRAMAESTLTVAPPSAAAQAAEEAFLAERVAAFEARGAKGQAGRYARRYTEVLDQAQQVGELAGVLDLEVADAGCERDLVTDFRICFDAFELGVSRCAMTAYNGWCSESWDTHQGIELQSQNFEDLFGYLGALMEELRGRTAADGSPLEDSVTIVVLSEMGRHPRYNVWGGKDHWTFTSAMLIGAGVQGGQVVGAVDDDLRGLPIDLATGEVHDGGTRLLPEHLGATLMALADVDPAEHGEAEPIEALMS